MAVRIDLAALARPLREEARQPPTPEAGRAGGTDTGRGSRAAAQRRASSSAFFRLNSSSERMPSSRKEESLRIWA